MYANINIFTRHKNTWYVCVNITLLHSVYLEMHYFKCYLKK